MQDHDLDKLLALASAPKAPVGFEQRLLNKITVRDNVVHFPQRRSSASWLIGLPLAASLALGIWLGATNILPGTDTLLISQTDEATNNGFDDVVTLIEDTKS